MDFKHYEKVGDKKCRPYQMDCIRKFIKKCELNNYKFNGKVVLPTGTGKTDMIIGNMMRHMIYSFFGTGTFPVMMLACHRGKLSQDNFTKIYKALRNILNELNLGLSVMILNSFGKSNITLSVDTISDLNEEETQEELNSVIGNKNYFDLTKQSSEDIAAKIEEDRKTKPVLILALYQSFDKVDKFKDVMMDIAFYDEAHIISSRKNIKYAKKMIEHSKINIFLTATETNDDTEYSMNKKEIFGDYIIRKEPSEMIEKKYITPIFIHQFHVRKSKGTEGLSLDMMTNEKISQLTEEEINNYKRLFLDCFIQVTEKVVDDFTRIGQKAKILTAVPGSYYLNKVVRENYMNRVFFMFEKLDLDVFMTYSNIEAGGGEYRYVKGEGFKQYKKKGLFIKDLKEACNNVDKHVLVLQIDQLTTGIDIPSFNALVPFKKFDYDTIKIMQFIGRGMRRDEEDEKKLIDDNSVDWKDFKKFKKPYCHLYCPCLFNSFEEANKFEKIVVDLQTAYGNIIFESKSGYEVSEDRGYSEHDFTHKVIQEEIPFIVKAYKEGDFKYLCDWYSLGLGWGIKEQDFKNFFWKRFAYAKYFKNSIENQGDFKEYIEFYYLLRKKYIADCSELWKELNCFYFGKTGEGIFFK